MVEPSLHPTSYKSRNGHRAGHEANCARSKTTSEKQALKRYNNVPINTRTRTLLHDHVVPMPFPFPSYTGQIHAIPYHTVPYCTVPYHAMPPNEEGPHTYPMLIMPPASNKDGTKKQFAIAILTPPSPSLQANSKPFKPTNAHISGSRKNQVLK